MSETNLSRRGFLQGSLMAGAGMLAAGALSGCAPKAQAVPHPEASAEQAHSYWLGEEPVVNEEGIVETRNTDFLIIGAGNAGMVAAATASDLGLDFILAEKEGCVGDTREYLGAINTKYSLEVADPVDEMKLLNELTRYASGRVDQRVIKTWLNEGKELVEWLTPIMEAQGKELVVTPWRRIIPPVAPITLPPPSSTLTIPLTSTPCATTSWNGTSRRQGMRFPTTTTW